MNISGTDIGPYRIMQKIAQGGMCAVYKGVHTSLEQEVAVKILLPESFENRYLRDKFINEAKIQARLSHPNVIKIFNYIEQDDKLFLVMEFVNGETLDMLLKKNGALAAERALAIFISVLDAVEFMHSKGIIHRDIKPSNIMISYDGFVKVMDFGIAKVKGDGAQTRAGVRIGTLWYMSPEQIRGEEATVQSDIYALGATLYQIVTGVVPFDGDTEFEIMKSHLEKSPISPCSINRSLPRDIGNIILKALAKSPADRYQSVRQMIDDVHKAISARDVTAVLPHNVEGADDTHVSFFDMHRGAITAIALSAIALLIFAVLYGLYYKRNGNNALPAQAETRVSPALPQGAEVSVVPAQSLNKTVIPKNSHAKAKSSADPKTHQRVEAQSVETPRPEPAPAKKEGVQSKWTIRK